MPLIITQGYGKAGLGIEAELVPVYGYGGGGASLCYGLFQFDSVELITPSQLRVRYTAVPLAVSGANPLDCLYIPGYTLAGPTSPTITQTSVVDEDSETIDLYLSQPLTPGTWTLSISSAFMNTTGQSLSAPYAYEFTIALVNQESLGQGATNDLCEDVLRKHFNPGLKGPGWDAMLAALAAGDCQNRTNGRLAFDQKFITSASGFYLDRKAGDQGVKRPDIGMGDPLYRELATTFRTNQLTQEGFLETLEVFYGTEAVRAYTESGLAQPFVFADGDTVSFTLDEKQTITVTFKRADFEKIRRASADEVSYAITRQFRESGSDAFAASWKDPDTGETRVRVYSPSRGLVSSIRTGGGTGQPKIQFGTVLFSETIDPLPEWSITIPAEYPAINKRARFKQLGYYFDLNKLRVGDYVTIISTEFSAGNRGVFEIVNVVTTPTEQYFEIENQDVVAEKPDQCCFTCVMFFRPNKRTIYDNVRYVVVAQHDGEMDVIIPATSQAVQRNLGTAAYLQEGASFTATSATRDAEGEVTVDALTPIDGGLAVGDQVIVDGFTPNYSPPPVYVTGGQTDSSERGFSFKSINVESVYHKATVPVLPGNDTSMALIFPGCTLTIAGIVGAYSTDVKRFRLTGTSLSPQGNRQFITAFATAGAAVVPTEQKMDYALIQSTVDTFMFGGVSTIWNNYANNYVSNKLTKFTVTSGGVVTATAMTNMPTAVARAQAILASVNYILAGGYTKHNASTNLQQKYLTGSNAWNAHTSLINRRMDHAMLSIIPDVTGYQAVGGRDLCPEETPSTSPDLLRFSFEDAEPVVNFTSTGSIALAINKSTAVRENGKIGYGISPVADTDLNAIAGATQVALLAALKNEWTIGTWMTSSVGSVFFSGGTTSNQEHNVNAEFGIINATGLATKKLFWRWQWGGGSTVSGFMDVPPTVLMPFAHQADQPVWYHMAVSKKLFLKEWDITGLTAVTPIVGTATLYTTANISAFGISLTVAGATWAAALDKGSVLFLGTGYTTQDQGWYMVYQRFSSTVLRIKKIRDTAAGSLTLPNFVSSTTTAPVWYQSPPYVTEPIQGLISTANQQKSLNGLFGATDVTLTVVSGNKVDFTRSAGAWPDPVTDAFQIGDMLFIGSSSKFNFANRGWYRVDNATTTTITATKVRDLFYSDLTAPANQTIVGAVQYLLSNGYPNGNGSNIDDMTAYQSTYDVSAYVNGMLMQTWTRNINSQYGDAGISVLGSVKKTFTVGQNTSVSYRGALDEFYMWSRPLTGTEVKQLVKGQSGTIRNVTRYVSPETVPARFDVNCATHAPLPAHTSLGQGPAKTISITSAGQVKNQYGAFASQISFDGYAPFVGEYVLVKDEGNGRSSTENGIYKVLSSTFTETAPGVFSQTMVLGRALMTLPVEFVQYSNVIVRGGVQNNNSQWILTSATSLAPDVDQVTFAHFLDYSGKVFNTAEAWTYVGVAAGFKGSMEYARYGFATVTVGNEDYVFGGMGHHGTMGPFVSRPLNSCEYLHREGSAVGRDWLPLPSMRFARAWPQAQYLEDTNEIAVWGGFGEAAQTVEFLSLTTRTWRAEALDLSSSALSNSFPASAALSVKDSEGVERFAAAAFGGGVVQSVAINPTGLYELKTAANEWLHINGESEFWAGGINGQMFEVTYVNSPTLPTIFKFKTPNFGQWSTHDPAYDLTITKVKAVHSVNTIGPYMFDPSSGVGIGNVVARLATKVAKGHKYDRIQLLATYDDQTPLADFHNEKGYLSINFGREVANQPVPYLFRGSQPVIIVHQDVRLATRPDAKLPTYVAAGAGLTHTLTGTVNGALTVDGELVVTGDRILVKDAVLARDNGIYTVTATGGTASVYVLTRAADFAAAALNGIEVNAYVAVLEGDQNHYRGWRLTTTGLITVETTSLTFLELTGTNELVLDYGYTFTNDADHGAEVTLLVSPSAYVPENMALVGGFYLTDTPAGRKAAEDFVNAIKATGFKLNLTITYPGDKGLGSAGYPANQNYKLSDKVVVWASSPIDEEVQEARLEDE